MKEVFITIIEFICNVLTIYTGACFLRIIFSWFPKLAYSGFGRFLSAVCDPYLNFFRRFRFLRMGFIDFSAALGIGVLWILGIILRTLPYGGPSFGEILGFFIASIWQLISTIISIYTIILVVRCIVLMFHNPFQPEGPFWQRLDSLIAGFVYKISNIFTGRTRVTYRTALIISIIFFLAVNFVIGKILLPMLIEFLNSLGGRPYSSDSPSVPETDIQNIAPSLDTIPQTPSPANGTPFINPDSKSI